MLTLEKSNNLGQRWGYKNLRTSLRGHSTHSKKSDTKVNDNLYKCDLKDRPEILYF